MTVTAPRDESGTTRPLAQPVPQPMAQPVSRPAVRPAAAVTPRRPPATSAAYDVGTVVSTTAAMVALVCLWVAAQLVWFGGISEARAQHLLYDRFRTELAAATAPVGPVTPVGDPVAYLDIPQIGLHQVVVEGTASGDLLAGPGHLRNTVLPGQVGTSVVLGRAATYGAPFRDLPSLKVGDRLSVTMAQGQRIFHVIGVRRAGDPLPQPPAAGVARLTLVTAEGSGRLGDIAPGRVVYVDAEAARGFPAPSGLPTAVPTPETVMRGDPGALPSLVLCLALLIGLTLGIVSARRRWAAVRVWVVACAPAVALAWLTTDVGVRLLPNLM